MKLLLIFFCIFAINDWRLLESLEVISKSLNYQSRGVDIDKIECSSNNRLCAKMICNMTKISRFVVSLTVGCMDLIKPMPKVKVSYFKIKKKKINQIYFSFFIQIRVTNYLPTNNNKYKKGFFDVTLDYCSIASGSVDVFLKMWWPKMKDEAGQMIHACPYKVYTMRIFVILVMIEFDNPESAIHENISLCVKIVFKFNKRTIYGKSFFKVN
jgi:hypothetical protein